MIAMGSLLQANEHLRDANADFHFPLHTYPRFHIEYINLPSYVLYMCMYATLLHI